MAHNGSIIPVPGRDIFVQAWYQGGLSVIDFTDSARPVEIAYFDRGPVSKDHLVTGGFWSTYWYGGRIYGTEIARGLDILTLMPSEQLSQNEIAAASLAQYGGRFNPQQQFPVSWPAHPVVALAYLDQLQRSGGLGTDPISALRQVLTDASPTVDGGKRDAQLASRIDALATAVLPHTSDERDASRATALRQLLGGIANRLR